MTTQELDTAKVEAFAGQMIGFLNGGNVALMTSIGYHTGLIDTMAGMPPATSAQIAQRAGLNERYVREWLGSMVTGRIIDYEPTSQAYRLPPEHAAVLTRAAGPNNLAVFAAFVPQMAKVEDEVVRTGNVMRVRADAVDPPIPGIAAVEQPAVADDRARGRELCTPPRFAVRLGIDDCGRGARLAVDDVAQPYPPRRALGRPKTDDRRVTDLRRTLGHVQL